MWRNLFAMRLKPIQGLPKRGTEDNSIHFVGIQTQDLFCAEMYLQNLFNRVVWSKLQGWSTHTKTCDLRRMPLQKAVGRWNFLLQKKFPIYVRKERLFESIGNMGFKPIYYLWLNRTFLKNVPLRRHKRLKRDWCQLLVISLSPNHYISPWMIEFEEHFLCA